MLGEIKFLSRNDGVKNLINKYSNMPTAMQGLGYKEVKEFLDGNISKEEMIEKIKMETRRYAKRQITWFKRIEKESRTSI